MDGVLPVTPSVVPPGGPLPGMPAGANWGPCPAAIPPAKASAARAGRAVRRGKRRAMATSLESRPIIAPRRSKVKLRPRATFRSDPDLLTRRLGRTLDRRDLALGRGRDG